MSGNTECFVGGHIPLGLLALVMLIVCVLFAVLVTIVPLMVIVIVLCRYIYGIDIS